MPKLKNKTISANQVVGAVDRVVSSPVFRSKWVIGILCAGIALVFIVQHIPLLYDWDIDSPSYYIAAQGISRGSDIYNQEQFQDLADEILGRVYIIYPYIYPPIVAQVFLPLTHLDYKTFSAVILLGNVILSFAVVALIYFLLNLSSRTTWLPLFYLFALLLFNVPLMRNLRVGQLNLVIFALILLSLYLDKKNRMFPASFFLMIAVFIKIFPALFILFYVLQKRWKYLWYSVISGAVLFSISVLVSGLSYWAGFVKLLFNSMVLGERPLYFFDFDAYLTNNSIKAFFTQLFLHLDLPRTYASAAFLLTLIFFFIFIYRRIPAFLRSQNQDYYASVLMILSLLVSGMCWQHHYVIILFPLAFVFTAIIDKKLFFLIPLYIPLHMALLYHPVDGGFPFNQTRLFASVLLLIFIWWIQGKSGYTGQEVKE